MTVGSVCGRGHSERLRKADVASAHKYWGASPAVQIFTYAYRSRPRGELKMSAGPALDFDLGEMADAIRDTTQRFAATRSRRSPPKIDAKDGFPTRALAEMGALGLHGITVEEEDGGLGLGYLEHVVAQEEMARASASVGLSYGAHSNLCVNQIRRWASAEQKAQYLPKLISRRACRARWRCARPARARDVVSMKLKAEKVGDGYRAQRHQILDHQCGLCRHAGRLCEDRRGQPRASPPS